MNSSLKRWLAGRMFESIGAAPVRFVLGQEKFSPPGMDPQFTVWIRDRKALFELLRDPEIGFGETYSSGRVRLDGDLADFLVAVYETMQEPRWYARAACQVDGIRAGQFAAGARRIFIATTTWATIFINCGWIRSFCIPARIFPGRR